MKTTYQDTEATMSSTLENQMKWLIFQSKIDLNSRNLSITLHTLTNITIIQHLTINIEKFLTNTIIQTLKMLNIKIPILITFDNKVKNSIPNQEDRQDKSSIILCSMSIMEEIQNLRSKIS